ncbi:hypothetical protein COCON_G00228560 [Conger conger]|uniref:C-type lectin domain-containing protein n=1 Tax=Conger conger TaxID=82655 RepID=A0A9Q1CUL9_CONCO|nr:hypothetical protein COCON_G00228560 [Conger conger]
METSALLILLSAGLCMSAFLGHYKRNLKAQSTRTNWTDAQTYCRENHMDLLTVHTLEEAERVQNIITEESILWIGLRRHQGPTKWSNGDIVHFDNRIEGDGRTPPYCHSMSASGRWVNVDCVQNKSFMCYDEVTEACNTAAFPTLSHPGDEPQYRKSGRPGYEPQYRK